MSLSSKKILGIRVTIEKKETILEEVKKWLNEQGGKSHSIVTPNPEQVVLARQEKRFAGIINRADVALPDGIGVAWAAGVPRIPGIEFMEDLVKLAAEQGATIGLIGGYGGLAVRVLECLSRRWPGLAGWVWEPGEVEIGEIGEIREIGEKIRKTNTRMVFVGLGAPKQEFFIEALSRQRSADSCILMSVGGSFDMIAGSLKRAPVLIRSIGFEWAWRLFQEPWRWKRQLALVKFVWMVVKERLGV